MAIPEISGHEFMESFKRGDREAFRAVYEAVGPDLVVFAEGVVKDREVADRIVAECFYRLFYQRESMTGVEDIRKWVFLEARNQCLAYLRE